MSVIKYPRNCLLAFLLRNRHTPEEPSGGKGKGKEEDTEKEAKT